MMSLAAFGRLISPWVEAGQVASRKPVVAAETASFSMDQVMAKLQDATTRSS